eukprot:3535996-Lingulodinium_polyedra.AAC.1
MAPTTMAAPTTSAVATAPTMSAVATAPTTTTALGTVPADGLQGEPLRVIGAAGCAGLALVVAGAVRMAAA